MEYNIKFMKHPGKFRTHWLGPYEVVYVTKGGVVVYVTKGGAAQLNTLNGEWKEGLVNGSQLKLYYEN